MKTGKKKSTSGITICVVNVNVALVNVNIQFVM